MERKYWYYIGIGGTIIISVVLYFSLKKSNSPSPPSPPDPPTPPSSSCEGISGKWIETDCNQNVGILRRSFVTDRKECNKSELKQCKVDCKISDKGTICDKNTGKSRTEFDIINTPKNGGTSCVSQLRYDKCDVDCDYKMSEYGICDPKTQRQIRYPVPSLIPQNNGKKCPNPEIKNC